MSRREYNIDPILINKLMVTKVIIDSHYEEKHGNSINDDLIIELVKLLNGRREVPDSADEDFQYFSTILYFEDKSYNLVWLLEDELIYIGVVNAYRDNRKV